MAKGKKKSGNSYTSKGERPNVAKRFRGNGIEDYGNSFARRANQLKAYNEGKPISNEILLMMGPRNSAETGRFHDLRKAK